MAAFDGTGQSVVESERRSSVCTWPSNRPIDLAAVAVEVSTRVHVPEPVERAAVQCRESQLGHPVAAGVKNSDWHPDDDEDARFGACP